MGRVLGELWQSLLGEGMDSMKVPATGVMEAFLERLRPADGGERIVNWSIPAAGSSDPTLPTYRGIPVCFDFISFYMCEGLPPVW